MSETGTSRQARDGDYKWKVDHGEPDRCSRGRDVSSYSQALGVVQDNIANVATPGYARQRVSLAPILVPITGQNLGVEISSIQSLRDNLLEAQVRIAGQTSSFFGKTAQIIESLEPAFRLSGGNSLGESIDSFFAAASALSVSPDDFNLRRGLLNAADRLAPTFRNGDELPLRRCPFLRTISICDVGC